MSAYFDLAAEASRREADRIIRKINQSRQVPVIDETERAMHHVHEAAMTFDHAREHTESLSRLRQLEERAATMEELWAQQREWARDKRLLILREES